MHPSNRCADATVHWEELEEEGVREGGRRQAGEAWKEETGRKWMDEKQVERALLPPFAWMGSVRRTTVCCVRWWLVFREIMSMCGSQQQECESCIEKKKSWHQPSNAVAAKTTFIGLGRSQSSSYWKPAVLQNRLSFRKAHARRSMSESR